MLVTIESAHAGERFDELDRLSDAATREHLAKLLTAFARKLVG